MSAREAEGKIAPLRRLFSNAHSDRPRLQPARSPPTLQSRRASAPMVGTQEIRIQSTGDKAKLTTLSRCRRPEVAWRDIARELLRRRHRSQPLFRAGTPKSPAQPLLRQGFPRPATFEPDVDAGGQEPRARPARTPSTRR